MLLDLMTWSGWLSGVWILRLLLHPTTFILIFMWLMRRLRAMQYWGEDGYIICKQYRQPFIKSQGTCLLGVMEIKGIQWQAKKCEESVLRQRHRIVRSQPKDRELWLKTKKQEEKQIDGNIEVYIAAQTLDTWLEQRIHEKLEWLNPRPRLERVREDTEDGDMRELSINEKKMVVRCLTNNQDIFAWSFADMPSIHPQVACHQLILDQAILPIKQKKHLDV